MIKKISVWQLSESMKEEEIKCESCGGELDPNREGNFYIRVNMDIDGDVFSMDICENCYNKPYLSTRDDSVRISKLIVGGEGIKCESCGGELDPNGEGKTYVRIDSLDYSIFSMHICENCYNKRRLIAIDDTEVTVITITKIAIQRLPAVD